MKAIPAALQTTYANLLQAHLNRPSFNFEGAPFKRILDGKTYWYANHRTAPNMPLKQRYLGPDTEEMRARIEEMKAQRQSRADFREYASSLIAQLRAGNIVGPDRKVGPMLRALVNSGVFRLGGTLVGTHAFRHYDLVLGAYLSDDADWAFQTDDIDVASFKNLSMVIDDKTDPDLGEALAQLGFRPAPSLTPKTPTSWTLADASYAIDFLTPSFKDEEGPTKLKALNIWAHSLHYLNFLIAEPIHAVTPYMEGLLVQIPRPERYAVHKLIVSQKRRVQSQAKKQKDIEQARTLIWAMSEDRPYEIKQAIAEADAIGEKWSTALDRALEVKFKGTRPIQNVNSGEIRFEVSALGQNNLRFAISRQALQDHFGVTRTDTVFTEHDAATVHRGKIEALIRKKFRSEPSPHLVVTSEDVSLFSPKGL